MTRPSTPLVGFIDSGLGLVDFADAFHRLVPHADLLLSMDPDWMPYGALDAAVVAERSGDAPRAALSALLRRPEHAPVLHAALDIHHAMSPVLAPATVEPPEFGAVLARLHAAAAAVVTAVTRDNGIG